MERHTQPTVVAHVAFSSRPRSPMPELAAILEAPRVEAPLFPSRDPLRSQHSGRFWDTLFSRACRKHLRLGTQHRRRLANPHSLCWHPLCDGLRYIRLPHGLRYSRLRYIRLHVLIRLRGGVLQLRDMLLYGTISHYSAPVHFPRRHFRCAAGRRCLSVLVHQCWQCILFGLHYQLLEVGLCGQGWEK